MLTGGGTLGHVMPHLPVLARLLSKGFVPIYIGSSGIEQQYIKNSTGIPYFAISSGKLRRYFSVKNFIDLFKIGLGLLQAIFILLKERPVAVFSKGGYVVVPVCYAAKMLGIPIIAHESDLSPGLATRLVLPICCKILTSFESTLESNTSVQTKRICVGQPVRDEIFSGDRSKISNYFSGNDWEKKPNLLVMGGSLGSLNINNFIELHADLLLDKVNIIHLTGKGKATTISTPNYYQAEFADKDLFDIFAFTDIVMSRSGANSIFEFFYLGLPMILVPLEKGSRGDQLENAAFFEKKGRAHVMREADLNAEHVLQIVQAETGKSKINEEVQGFRSIADGGPSKGDVNAHEKVLDNIVSIIETSAKY